MQLYSLEGFLIHEQQGIKYFPKSVRIVPGLPYTSQTVLSGGTSKALRYFDSQFY